MISSMKENHLFGSLSDMAKTQPGRCPDALNVDGIASGTDRAIMGGSKMREKLCESVYYFQYAFKRIVEMTTKGRKSYRPSHIYDPYDEWSRAEFKPLIEGI